MNEQTTWDGAPISPDKPYGATIVVYQRKGDRLEFLILHRAHEGPEYEGAWAWTPPSGARQPGETIETCARRELAEETGLSPPLQPTDFGTEDWRVFLAEAAPEAAIRLSAEHDRWDWVTPEEAARKCKPSLVGEQLRAARRFLKDGF